jgi:hypothetical protein
MHNHDTNETFIAMTGRWRCEWNEGSAQQSIDLDPYDVISFPGRRRPPVLERHVSTSPKREHLLMFIIGGNQPQAEFTPLAMQALRAVAAGASSSPRASAANVLHERNRDEQRRRRPAPRRQRPSQRLGMVLRVARRSVRERVERERKRPPRARRNGQRSKPRA